MIFPIVKIDAKVSPDAAAEILSLNNITDKAIFHYCAINHIKDLSRDRQLYVVFEHDYSYANDCDVHFFWVRNDVEADKKRVADYIAKRPETSVWKVYKLSSVTNSIVHISIVKNI